MTPQQEVEYYREYLGKGAAVLCKAMGVSCERYDTDQADGECYLDCFKEAADTIERLIKYSAQAGIAYRDQDSDLIEEGFLALPDEVQHAINHYQAEKIESETGGVHEFVVDEPRAV